MSRTRPPKSTAPNYGARLAIGVASGAVTLILTGCIAVGETWGAADTARMGHGRTIAQERCGVCHAVSGVGPSPNALAPAFTDIAVRYSRTGLERELQAINEVGHYAMPKMALSAGERESLAAYIYKGRAGP